MLKCQGFHVTESDHFEETKYPQINKDLKAIGLRLGDAAGTPGTAMLLSFVRYHSINSTSVTAYPALASMISTKELPLGALGELFEASKKNPTFQKELETHIETCLNSNNRAFLHNKSSI